MKQLFYTTAILLSICIISLRVQAQEIIIEEPNTLLFISQDRARSEIIQIMNNREHMRFHDPKAPRFLLTDRQGKFAMGIGGYVRATSEYDFNGIVENVDFYPSLISNVSGMNYAKNQYQMDLTTTALFLKLVGHTKRLGDFIVYTGGNFRGKGRNFQLHNAYIQFLGFTIGYNYGAFMDLSALPPAIDYAGPNGSTCYRTPLICYTCHPWNRWKFAISIESPSVSGTPSSETLIQTQRMPDFGANAQFNWNSKGHVKIAGIIRSMTYSTELKRKTSSITGFGIQASTTFSPIHNWKAFGQVNYGKGIGTYLNDLSNLSADLLPNPTDPGKLQALPMMGWFTGMQLNISSSAFISATFSQARLYSKHLFGNTHPDFYKRGEYLATNIFWNITPNLQTGIEYLRGWRHNFNNSARHANRINALLQYSF